MNNNRRTNNSGSIMKNMDRSREEEEIKRALDEIGCDIDDIKDLCDIPDVIRNSCTGPNNNDNFNSTIIGGPGVYVVPTGKYGYKLLGNSEALLVADLAKDLPKGSSVQKALYTILHKEIPKAKKEAAMAPSVVRMDLVKISYDGIDYYDNPAFSPKGNGRRGGLRPDSWYIRLFTAQMKEPLYLDLGPVQLDIKKEVLKDTRKMIESYVNIKFKEHIKHYHSGNEYHKPGKPSPGKPGHNHHDHDCDFDWDEIFGSLCSCEHNHENHHGNHGNNSIDPGMTIPDPGMIITPEGQVKPEYNDDIDPGMTIPDPGMIITPEGQLKPGCEHWWDDIDLEMIIPPVEEPETETSGGSIWDQIDPNNPFGNNSAGNSSVSNTNIKLRSSIKGCH